MDCHWYRNSLYNHFLYWNKGTSRTPSKKDQHTHGSSGMKQHKISIALSSTTSHLSQPLAMDDSQPRFLSQESVVVTLLRYCCEWLQHCFIATLLVLRWKLLWRIHAYNITFSPALYGLFPQIMTLMFLQGLPDMHVSTQERIIFLNSHWFSWELKRMVPPFSSTDCIHLDPSVVSHFSKLQLVVY